MKPYKHFEIKRWNEVLLLFYKPMTPSQISELTGESIYYVSFVLEKFAERQIARCINPEAKRGRIYALTEKGRRLRKKQLAQRRAEASMPGKDHALHDYQDFKENTDIGCYRFVVAGKDRIEFIKKMRGVSSLKGYFTAPDILAFYRREGERVPRFELYRAIRFFINKGMLSRFNISSRRAGFRFTAKGWLMASQV